MHELSVTITILGQPLLYQLTIDNQANLLKCKCLFDDLPEAAQRLAFGDAWDDMLGQRRAVEALLPLTIPLWAAVGRAPAGLEALISWSQVSKVQVPNYLNSPYPKHLWKHYSFEYTQLAIKTIALIEGNLTQSIIDKLYSCICGCDFPLGREIVRTLLPHIYDRRSFIAACGTLLKIGTSEDYETVVEYLRQDLAQYGVDEVTPSWWNFVELPILPMHRGVVKVLEEFRVEAVDFFSQNGEDEIAWLIEEKHRYPEIQKRKGVIYDLVTNKDKISTAIDTLERYGEWSIVLSALYELLLPLRKYDDRIPTPRQYVYNLCTGVNIPPIILGPSRWVHDIFTKYHSLVDLDDLLSKEIVAHNSFWPIKIIESIYRIEKPSFVRQVDGKIVRNSPDYPVQIYLTEDAKQVLLEILTDWNSISENYSNQVIGCKLAAIFSISTYDEAFRERAVDYCLRVNFKSCNYNLNHYLLKMIANLIPYDYRSKALRERMIGHIISAKSLDKYLVTEICCTHDDELIKLLISPEVMPKWTSDDYVFREVSFWRFGSIEDRYHGIHRSPDRRLF